MITDAETDRSKPTSAKYRGNCNNCALFVLESSASVRHFDLDGYEKIDQALLQSNDVVIASLSFAF
ncbi:hypothetical protein PILCRDRAFT_820496 [Piloderma croceum F 1598]|uniref:Uncharacterized protein n=1 Tax=Piloderma croceum (strain F 1598) TaxID=765440 RepID=A0A0C3FDX2_PILCF|nr:hypothetical protein PILCRDRAFT_820496 [Piloderma croceum F 1598]